MRKCNDYASCGDNQALEIAVNSNPIAVIIPCYNEALTITKLVDDFHREQSEATVYAYNNNSTDSTAQIAREHGATVKFEPRQGKSNGCRQMFRDIEADCNLMADRDGTAGSESKINTASDGIRAIAMGGTLSRMNCR